MTKREYNDIPVEFCSRATCCSLAIADDDGVPYCLDCGGVKTSKAHISVWEEYWIMAHGDKLINMKKSNEPNTTEY